LITVTGTLIAVGRCAVGGPMRFRARENGTRGADRVRWIVQLACKHPAVPPTRLAAEFELAQADRYRASG
jgi:hypothetical protein